MPEPDSLIRMIRFDGESLLAVRGEVARVALASGMSPERATELVTAVNEVATNSVQHGGGGGTVRIWREPKRLICEVHDRGLYWGPVGRPSKPLRTSDHCGLWLSNRLCDLVQIHTVPDGTAVRLHMRVDR